MLWPRRKLIFTVLIQRRPPERVNALREKQLAGYVSKASRESHIAKHPINRYNNLVGFAEIYWDRGTRIDIDYYFLGNRSTTAGKRLVKHRNAVGDKYYLEFNPKCYYLYSDGVEVGSILPRATASKKRKEINDALDHVERTVEELRFYVDLSHEREMVEYLDVDQLFSGGAFDL